MNVGGVDATLDLSGRFSKVTLENVSSQNIDLEASEQGSQGDVSSALPIDQTTDIGTSRIRQTRT